MFTLAIAWPTIRQALLLSLLACLPVEATRAAPANWFPDTPIYLHYSWTYHPCPGCQPFSPHLAWERMAALAGLPEVRFQAAPDESGGPAYSAAPNVVVLSPAALQLETCQLAFLIGHEIVHISQRHFDEDAIALHRPVGIIRQACTLDGQRGRRDATG